MEYDYKKIEKKWQKTWKEEDVYEPDLDDPESPFYNLMMFPYPSAEGLHVGNMYAFTGSDVYGRFKRMQGNDVFEPIGLDGFGIHSENYAMKVGTHPVEQAKKSEENFYKQLRMTGNGFAWEEKLETYKPDYYRWTQWLFIQMYKNGLAYRKTAPVNWCPGCKTVLADEQVIAGECERCNSEVVQKNLSQWFFKITDYADRLLDDLEGLDWSKRVKTAQRNWIGRSEGSLLNFKVSGTDAKDIKVFTTRPDTLFGATYMVLAPEHDLVEKLIERGVVENENEVKKYVEEAKHKTEQERKKEAGEKSGVEISGIKAINPATKEEIPIWIADYVLSTYGTGAIMAVPAHDERDYEFAKKFDIPIKEVISYEDETEEVYTGEGKLVNSGKFDGTSSKEAREEITNFVDGTPHTNYKLRDWLISRQRYWGPPIPIIYCENCWEPNDKEDLEEGVEYDVINGKPHVIHPVPEDDLPIELPYVEDFRPKGKGKSPLATSEEFYKTECPECGGEAIRETDVSDTFLDSSWYYFRYIDRENDNEPFSESRVKSWLPVDMYIGGAEHSVLHLLYTRFVTKAFHDWGLISFDEPFKKFRAHGLLIKEGAKMSKSKGNVINPDDYIEKFGADVLRTYLMFLAPFEEGGDFRDEGMLGITRFLDRVWKFYQNNDGQDKDSEGLERERHKAIKKVTEDIENLKYNTAISHMMVLLDAMRESEKVSRETMEDLLKLLSPFAPHLTEEIWRETLEHDSSIHISSWPEYKENRIAEETFQLVVQVNGKVRDKIEMDKGISKQEAEKAAKKSEDAQRHLGDKEIKKVIYVEDKLINFVV